jgi:RNA polymerase sigma-70 factor (ECF subfamily)
MNFGEVYERYVHDVHRFCLYLSGNEAAADDLTAETFVHAFYGPSDIRINTVKAYLLAIARNLYRDLMLRQRRLVAIGEVEERADRAPQPDRRAAGRQALRNVLEAIQRLPEPQREALALAVDQDLSYKQIAVLLGCSEPAVKVRIHRARLQLTREVEAKEKIWKT